MKQKFDIQQNIVNEIASGTLTMHSAAHMRWRKGIATVLLLLIWAGIVYFASLTIFKFHLYDPFSYLSLGSLGLRAFYSAIPWKIIGIGSLLLIIGGFMLRKREWVYRRGVRPAVIGVAAFLVISASAVNATGIHQALWDRHVVPFLYHGQFIGDYWVMGKVTSISSEAGLMQVVTPNNETANVLWGDGTIFPQGSHIQLGDIVQEVGENKDSRFSAEGIVIESRVGNAQ